ncbi:hypothetical protein L218DRAFT_1074426 [Marasmius fiardii PR-910]|nr:hypothetical protein L218DRAFT_1074426 [Marasmius fiardii PR-910]
MSEETLPLKIRVDIRDLFDSPSSTVHEAMANLEKILGHQIPAEPEWPALWSTLQPRFPEKSTFVPTIAHYTIGWYERLLGRLENDAYAVWTEQLLSVLAESRRRLLLKVEPSQHGSTGTYITWNSTLRSFHLGIGNSDPLSESRLAGVLDGLFNTLFTEGGQQQGQGSSSPLSSSLPTEDDWADVDIIEKQKEKPWGPADNGPWKATRRVERLPTVDTLARPNELFRTTSPQLMIIHQHRQSLTVQCSHQPSLELLQAYLTKWAKTNTNDSLRRPVFKYDLVESEFSFGIIDTLHIEANMTYTKTVNPTIILAFVEGVLGYTMVHTTGSSWMYRTVTLSDQI